MAPYSNSQQRHSQVRPHVWLLAAAGALLLLLAVRSQLPQGGGGGSAGAPRRAGEQLAGGQQQQQQHESCSVKTEYFSSAVEKEWLANVDKWQDDYCTHARPWGQDERVKKWLDAAGKQEKGEAAAPSYDPAVFSRFETTHTCGAKTETRTTYIEPLAFGLRHPLAFCDGNPYAGHLMDRSYLLLAAADDVAATAPGQQRRCVGRACTAFFFDLGAGTYGKSDIHTPAQQWFHDGAKRRGLEFSRMLMWEMTVFPPTQVFGQVPEELYHKYQYFNIPVTPNVTSAANPVNILKAIAQPDDYVMFKLDIDNGAVESAIFNYILDDPAALALVDEFMYEYHVTFAPLDWAWGKTIDATKRQIDAYQLFLKLRQRGVRAHGWV